tara:strand:- start:252 stop:524 length:273 start_codon:yes stop_codon:yes gene_type:complete
MAIDSEQRRRAVAGLPLLPVSLLPDGTISQVDRQQVGWGYPGISAATVVEGSAAGTLDWSFAADGLEWTHATDPMEYTPAPGPMEWSSRQ